MLRVIGYVGDWNTGTVITLNVYNYTNVTGTYKISGTGPAGGVYADNATGVTKYATSGSVTISQVFATNVQGAFYFTADSISVTGGEFNIPVQ